MRLVIELEMNNQAFEDGNHLFEAGTILAELGAEFEGGSLVDSKGILSDTNGNTCGKWKITGKASQ